MEFDWDKSKNATNIKKHKISFNEAKELFDKPVFTWVDDRHDYGEIRRISIGELGGSVVLVVAHTERNNKCRIISARKAKLKEREKYYDYIEKKA
jgi:hypothetical protein